MSFTLFFFLLLSLVLACGKLFELTWDRASFVLTQTALAELYFCGTFEYYGKGLILLPGQPMIYSADTFIAM